MELLWERKDTLGSIFLVGLTLGGLLTDRCFHSLHTADDYFNILVGEQWAFAPGQLEMEVYPAGSVHHLPRGMAKQYKMHKNCFALEYARGMSFYLPVIFRGPAEG